MQPVLRAALTLAFVLAIGPAVAAEAPPQSPPRSNPSPSDGPADNLNRFMLKISDQCYAMSDAAQRAECCRHLIENLCSTDTAKK